MRWYWIGVLFLILIFVIIYILWAKERIIVKWNDFLTARMKNEQGITRITSIQDAWISNNIVAHEIQQNLALKGLGFRSEIKTFMEHCNNLPAIDIEKQLKPVGWQKTKIHSLTSDSGLSRHFPVLRKIAKESGCFEFTLNIIWPGTSTDFMTNNYSGVVEYHYAVKIPEDSGLEIGGTKLRWREGNGFVWDNNLPHRYFNNGTKPCVFISAIIPRNLNGLYRLINRVIYGMTDTI